MLKIIKAPTTLGYLKSGSRTFADYLEDQGLEDMLEDLKIPYTYFAEIPETRIKKKHLKPSKCRLVEEVTEFSKNLAAQVEKSINSDKDFPLIIGGDHSLAIGSVAGLLRKRKNLGVLWLDAHPDIHTSDTTLTGWTYGMASAVICGYGDSRLTKINQNSNLKVNPKNLVLFGCQFIDKPEKENIKNSGVNLISLENIIEKGIAGNLDQAIKIFKQNKIEHIHVSLDLDVIDEQYAPGTTECSKGLLSYREIKYIFRKLGESGLVTSMDIVEGDPIKDVEGKTAQISLELIANVLGKEYSEYDRYITNNRI